MYADAIESVSDPDARPGALAVIFDRKRRFAAIGLWDPASPIRVRVLHAGSPRTIDADFWTDRVTEALARRHALLATGTTGYRLLHGENDGTGAAVVDVYDRTAVLKLYSSAWFPHLRALTTAVVDVVSPERIVLRLARLLQAEPELYGLHDGLAVYGSAPDGPVRFVENGLEFDADVVRGQKTGHFLDQRNNRAHVRDRSAGRTVLDVFAHTGGFSVHAAAGGATLVHSVDSSPHAIEAAVHNMAINHRVTGHARHETTVGDAFEVMRELGDEGQQYDIVVVDPPSFAKNTSERPAALRAYRALADLAIRLLPPGGRLVQASCSSRVTGEELESAIVSAVSRSGRTTAHERRSEHALDHPISFPQGGYLNAFSAVIE